MTHKIKAVFFDVDSTMYFHDIHDLLPKTKAALWQLHEQGILVAVATSRCRSELKNMPAFFRMFPFAAVISDGGALVMEQKTIVEAHFLPHELVERIASFAKQHQRTFRYSTVDGNYFTDEPNQIDKDLFFQLYLNVPIQKPYEQDDVLNILLYTRTVQERSELKQLLGQTSFVTHGEVVEINAGSIDKSSGVKVLADRWGLSMAEMMCFGDGANDVEMLQACGIGVAMGNGCDAAKQAADYVTKRIEEDGIDHALRHYGLIA